MTEDNIIHFNNRERILDKVRAYLTAIDELAVDGQPAVDLLLKGFDLADDEMKVKIVIMLGTVARQRVVTPLLEIMRNRQLSGSIRQAAAVQLSVVGDSLKNTESLVDELLSDLENASPSVRANAAFALGWVGNLRAAPELIDCLVDDDIEVQQAAVNALSNLRDDSLFSLLTQRLEQGSKEQQRSILYNLGHFTSRRDEVAMICKTYLHHNDADLRYDALVVFNIVAEPAEHLTLYTHCLKDKDPRIRELALGRLTTVARQPLVAMAPTIRTLVRDPSPRVRQAATRLIHRMDSISIAGEGD